MVSSSKPVLTYFTNLPNLQAPTRGKRPSLRNKPAKSQPTLPTTPATPSKTKKSKRTTKHLTFVTKISKATSQKTSTSVKKGRRRRPSKPLLATLESLADALPDTSEIPSREDGGATLLRKKSLRSRPGALKRKAKVERGERERFNKNLAQMVGVAGENGAGAASPAATSTRWAALRGFVSQTLERKEEFCL
jgi:Ribosome biogenesis protein SLX9